MSSRPAGGGLGALDPVDDPVVARRRAQIKEFLAAWRAALKGAREAEGNKAARRPMPMAPAATTGPDPAAPAAAPATSAADTGAPRVAPPAKREPGERN